MSDQTHISLASHDLRVDDEHDDPGHRALLLVRDRDDSVVAAAGYRLTEPGRAEFACTVGPKLRRAGLGTFLLRRLAELALANGISRFHVVAGSDDSVELVRDCGLRSHWESLRRPLEVELELAGRRPGWSTPSLPVAASASPAVPPAGSTGGAPAVPPAGSTAGATAAAAARR